SGSDDRPGKEAGNTEQQSDGTEGETDSRTANALEGDLKAAGGEVQNENAGQSRSREGGQVPMERRKAEALLDNVVEKSAASLLGTKSGSSRPGPGKLW
ncbi:hypothetical protein ACFL0Q_03135, partial [Thermodesulfobacteriota bacterium]